MRDLLARGSSVVVFGAGGHARAVVDVLRRLDTTVLATVDPGGDPRVPGTLLDDDEGIRHARAHGLPGVVAIGDNRRRLDLAVRLEADGVALPPVVATTATIAADASLGAGTIVMEHAHVGAAAVLGIATLVNTGAVVEHDCRLRAGVHCAPRSALTGSVHCGRRVLVGAGAVVLPGTTLGDDALAAAGCVVVDDVPARQTVYGVPGRPRRVVVTEGDA